jgi:hypothetical protein
MLAPGVDGISNTVHPVGLFPFGSSSTEFIWPQNFVHTCGTIFSISVKKNLEFFVQIWIANL